MNLYLRKEDFKDLFNRIRNQFNMAHEYDGGDLFINKYALLNTNNIEFGLGDYDTALFFHHHPYDAEDYNSISVRTLYEELVLLKKNKVPEKDIIYEDRKYGRYINIGKMIEKRQLEREALLNKEWDQLNPTKTVDSKFERAVLTESNVATKKIKKKEENNDEKNRPNILKQKRRKPKLR